MLSVEDLEASYGPVRALDGVSLRVEQGAIVALLGANGAGKTTVLKAISGILAPRRGRVVFAGKVISALPPDKIVACGISHVPEGRQIFTARTIKENLILGGYSRTKAEAKESMEQVFSIFPFLGERMEQRAGHLSGGQQQMLALGRAMMARPQLLMLDEPSLGLSPLLTREIFSKIRLLRDGGMTILVVEQNARIALEVADYAYLLETGRVAGEGTAASLQEDPAVQEVYLGKRRTAVTEGGLEA